MQMPRNFLILKKPYGCFLPYRLKNADKLAKVTYSRPQLKGRRRTCSSGKVWRTGAKQKTLDMKLGETKVKQELILYMSRKDSYTIIIKDLNVWGSYYYKEANDVARLKVPVTEALIH
jgi:hypothetical protein